MRFILVDPGRVNLIDVVNIENPRYKGVPIVRFRRAFWGDERYPPLQIIDSKGSQEIILEELKEIGRYSGEIGKNDSPTNP